VNIDHVATLRQLRAGTVDYPDLVAARDEAIDAGAEQITIHLRQDRRHIQDLDLGTLAANHRGLLNLEMAATDEMLQLALKHRPDYVCLVPEKREEVTTEGGLDVVKNKGMIGKVIATCKPRGIRVSLFIEPDLKQIEISRELNADAVEFHTGRYALTCHEAALRKVCHEGGLHEGKNRKETHEEPLKMRGGENRIEPLATPTSVNRQRDALCKQTQTPPATVSQQLEVLHQAFEHAHNLSLHVHAGHGLDYKNVGDIVKLPHIEELNTGHSIVCRAVMVGMFEAVREMKYLVSGDAHT